NEKARRDAEAIALLLRTVPLPRPCAFMRSSPRGQWPDVLRGEPFSPDRNEGSGQRITWGSFAWSEGGEEPRGCLGRTQGGELTRHRRWKRWKHRESVQRDRRRNLDSMSIRP